MILDASFTLLHEEIAHALENLKTNANSSDPLTDHFKFNGEFDTYSPSILKVLIDEKYSKTLAHKVLLQLMKELEIHMKKQTNDNNNTSKGKK